MKTLRVVVLGIFSLFLASCFSIPMSRVSIVPDGVAKSADELYHKLEYIRENHMGKDEAEIRQLLNIKPKTRGVKDIVDAKEKRDVIYAGFEVRGTPAEAEQFRKDLERQNVLEIVFSDFDRRLTVDSVVSALTTKDGPEYKAHLIFLDGKLTEVRNPKNYYKTEKTRTYITEFIGTAVIGGANQGVRQIK